MSSFPGRGDRYYSLSQVHQYGQTPPKQQYARTPPGNHYGRTPPGTLQYARTPPTGQLQFGRTPPTGYMYARTPPNHQHPRVLHATHSSDRVSVSFIVIITDYGKCQQMYIFTSSVLW